MAKIALSRDSSKFCKCNDIPKKSTKAADKVSAAGDQLSKLYQDSYKEIFDNGDGAEILQIQSVQEVGKLSNSYKFSALGQI